MAWQRVMVKEHITKLFLISFMIKTHLSSPLLKLKTLLFVKYIVS